MNTEFFACNLSYTKLYKLHIFMKDFREIEELAFKGQEVPNEYTLLEQYAYICTRSIYNEYRMKNISQEVAKSERDKVKKAYIEQSDILESRMKLFKNMDSIRVSLAKISKEMALNGCGLCKRFLKILDGRLKYE